MSTDLKHRLVDMKVFVPSVAIGIIGPLVATYWTALPLKARFIANAGAVLPLFGLLIGMQVLAVRSARERGQTIRGRKWLGALFLLLIGLFLFTFFMGVPDLLGAGPTTTWLTRLAALFPLALVGFALYRAFPQIKPAPESSAEDDGEIEAEGGVLQRLRARLSAFWGWLWSKLGGTPEPVDEPEEEEEDPEGQPAWLYAVLAALPDGVDAEGEPELIDPENVAPLSASAELDFVFGGVRPTVDQAAFFESFDSSYRKLVASLGYTHKAGDGPGADFLLTGEPGTGRTTSLLACAVYAAFVRGQRVLFLVPDEQRQDAIKQVLDAFLRRARLDYYVQIGVVDEPSVRSWITRPDAPIPNVMVSTLEALEKELYGGRFTAEGEVERLRQVIRLLEVVLVDDFLDFADVERSHLPFALSKHRLLLASDYVPMQLVVTCGPLANIARDVLVRRLFKVARGDSVQWLRPREGQRGWRVSLIADDVKQAIDALIPACIDASEEGLDVVLYRRGIDRQTREAQQAVLRQQVSKGSVTVLSDLDQPLSREDEVDAVFYQVAVYHDVCVALRLKMGHGQTVVFAVSPRDDVHEEIPDGVVPILADRTAMPLLVSHLHSALRLIRPATPVDDEEWLQFGVEFEELETGRASAHLARFDRDEWDDEDSRYPTGGLWPYVVLRTEQSDYEPIDVHTLPTGIRQLRRHPTEPTFYITSDRSKEDSRTTARWSRWRLDDHRAPRTVDLAHLSHFRLVAGPDVYVPRRIESKSERIDVSVARWQGDGSSDYYLPVWRLAWSIPAGAQSGGDRGGGEQHGVGWYGLDLDDDPRVDATICGRMNDAGMESRTPPVKFAYPARVAALILAPNDLPGERMQQDEGRLLEGDWSTDRGEFLPGLTGALSYAFNARIPGLLFFAKVLAFRLEGDRRELGRAACFLVQPDTAGQTVLPLLSQLFVNDPERHSFFRSVHWFLESMQAAEHPDRFLRRRSQMAFRGAKIEDVATSAAWVKRVFEPAAEDTRQPIWTDSAPEAAPEPAEPTPDQPPSPAHISPQRDVHTLAWRTDLAPESWDDVASELFRQIEARFPDFPALVLSDWDMASRVFIDANGDRAEVAPTDGMLGAEYREAVVAALRKLGDREGLDARSTVSVQLWVAARSRVAEGRPRFDDPVNTTVMGGWASAGLLRAAEVTRLAPTPDASEQPPELADLLFLGARHERPASPDAAPVTWGAALPPAPQLGQGAEFEWQFRGRQYVVRWGFETAEQKQAYMATLDALKHRPNNNLSFYVTGDPYLDAVAGLADKLLELYGGEADSGFAEFALAFVQSIAYIADPPVDGSDWPRFASEYLANGGGDCEDSAATYVALLARVGADIAFLRMDSHVAVGVAGPYNGVNYTFRGTNYYVAETAMDRSYKPLGSADEQYGEARVVRFPGRRLPSQSAVSLLGFDVQRVGGDSTMSVTLASRLTEQPLVVAAYHRMSTVPFDGAETTLLGAVTLDGPPQPGQTTEVQIPLAAMRRAGTHRLDLVVFGPAGIAARWLGGVAMNVTFS